MSDNWFKSNRLLKIGKKSQVLYQYLVNAFSKFKNVKLYIYQKYEQDKVDKSYVLHIQWVSEEVGLSYYHIYHKKVNPASPYNHIYCIKSNLSCKNTMWICEGENSAAPLDR